MGKAFFEGIVTAREVHPSEGHSLVRWRYLAFDSGTTV